MTDYWKVRGSYANPLPNARDREFLVDMNTGELFMGFNGSNVKISDHALQLAAITAIQNKKVLQVPDSFLGKAKYALCVNSTEDGYILSQINKGDTGDPGTSAYQIWLSIGNTGNESAFIASLKGQQGDPGTGDMISSVYDTDGDGKVNSAEVADEVEWDGVNNKPLTYPPETHSHNYEPALANPDATGKALSSSVAGVKSWIGVEPPLGNPAEDEYILSSTAAGVRSWIPAPEGGGANLALLAHSNAVSSNTDTDYSTVATASVFASALRFKRDAMQFHYVEKGNGNCQFIISDGTATVTAVGTNANSSTDALGKIEADCSTLSYGTWWTIEVQSKAVSGAYEMRRINIMADPASPMTGNTIMLSSPNYDVSSTDFVLVEDKFYPTHYLIDADSVISFDAKCVVTSGTLTLRCVVTPVLDNTGTLTTPATSEEESVTVDASGNASMLVRTPSILAPMIRIRVYASTTGVANVNSINCWAEV